MNKFFLYIFCFAVTLHLYSANRLYAQSENRKVYYVSAKGSDSNNGSPKKPWRTLGKAVASVPKDGLKTILLDEGIFTESKPLLLPSGTSIKGAGVGKTFVKSTIFHPPGKTHHMMAGADTLYLLQIRGSDNWEISHITFDGLMGTEPLNEEHMAFGGIFVSDAANFNFHHVAVDNFLYNGLWIQNADQFEVYNSSFDNDGIGAKNGCNGLIHVGDIKNAVFHDLKIREYRGNDGLRTYHTRWSKGRTPVNIENVLLYNIDVKLRRNGGWGQGQPNEDICFWNCAVYNSEIRNCRINDKIANQGRNNETSIPSLRIHHCEFPSGQYVGKVYTYQIEHDTNNTEIDNNIFINGIWNYASWNSTGIKRHKYHGLNFHHNLFYQPEGLDIFRFNNSMSGLLFYNNFFLLGNNMLPETKGQNAFISSGVIGEGGIIDSLTISRNVFASDNVNENKADLIELRKDSKLGQHQISNNLFKNWKPQGDNSVVTDDIQFNASDFRFAPGSPIFQMGIENIDVESVGLTKDYFFAQPEDSLGMVWVKRAGGKSSETLLLLAPGEKVELEASGRTNTGFVANLKNARITYTTNMPDVVKIRKNKVTALKAGTAEIEMVVTKNGVVRKSKIYIRCNEKGN